MFDIFRLKEVLVQYKKVFVSEQWPNEKYKWEAVKCFQDNWDINAKDFADTVRHQTFITLVLLHWPKEFVSPQVSLQPHEKMALHSGGPSSIRAVMLGKMKMVALFGN